MSVRDPLNLSAQNEFVVFPKSVSLKLFFRFLILVQILLSYWRLFNLPLQTNIYWFPSLQLHLFWAVQPACTPCSLLNLLLWMCHRYSIRDIFRRSVVHFSSKIAKLVFWQNAKCCDFILTDALSNATRLPVNVSFLFKCFTFPVTTGYWAAAVERAVCDVDTAASGWHHHHRTALQLSQRSVNNLLMLTPIPAPLCKCYAV